MVELYQKYLQHQHVFIDSRKTVDNGLFFAVGRKNEQGVHRGNEFAEDVIFSGKAAYAVVNDLSLIERHPNDKRFIYYEDCEKTLQELAAYHRKRLTIPILAIAGSNGKTTLKELLNALFSTKFKTFATAGNLNNYLGVPLSILSIHEDYDIAILEIGANHLYETAMLAAIIQPDYGVVTNCGKDHLGEYGSIENIIRANKELYDNLAKNNKTAFVSANQDLLLEMSQAVVHRILFGKDHKMTAKVLSGPFLSLQFQVEDQNIQIDTQLFGRFWMDTVLSAASIATCFDIDLHSIKKSIEGYKPQSLRSQLIKDTYNSILLDCYNANPSSMEVFIQEIQQEDIPEQKVLILGEMLELGQYSVEEHETLIQKINASKFSDVLLVGRSFERFKLELPENFYFFEHHENAKQFYRQKNYIGKFIFVKGSRSNQLEKIFQ